MNNTINNNSNILKFKEDITNQINPIQMKDIKTEVFYEGNKPYLKLNYITQINNNEVKVTIHKIDITNMILNQFDNEHIVNYFLKKECLRDNGNINTYVNPMDYIKELNMNLPLNAVNNEFLNIIRI